MAELSQEEKEKIYLEEKARIEAKEKLKKESVPNFWQQVFGHEIKSWSQAPPPKRIIFLSLVAIVLIGASWLFYYFLFSSVSSVNISQQKGLTIGQVYRLVPGSRSGLIALDETSFNQAHEALVINDMARIYRLLQAGKAFSVKSGTSTKLIKSGIIKVQISIQEGDMIGKIGWVPREWLK